MTEPSAIRTLHAAVWEPGISHAACQERYRAFLAAAALLASRFPARVLPAHAADGTYHLLLEAPFQQGRLARRGGDTLCKRRFFLLEEAPGFVVECLACLEIAERVEASRL